MKIFYALVLVHLAISSVHSQPLIQTREGKELLVAVDAALGYNDYDSPELAKNILAAQKQIAAKGPRTNEMLAEMVVEELAVIMDLGDPSKSANPPGPNIEVLLNLVSYDPTPTQKLLGPLMTWMDAAAAGKIQNGSGVTQMAALHINKWGDDQEKARVKADTETMMKSSDYETHRGGEMIQRALEGHPIAGWPRMFDGTLSEWCQGKVNFAEDRKAGKPIPPPHLYPGMETGIYHNPAEVPPPPPASSSGAARDCLIGTFISVGVIGAVGWMVLRKRRHFG